MNLGNFSEFWCPDCGNSQLHEYIARYPFQMNYRCPDTNEVLTESRVIEHVVIKCDVCTCELMDYRGEDVRYKTYADWLFEKTGILIDELGNRIN